MSPGQVLVHHNIANLVNHTDLNRPLVIQYAVDVIKVKHIIVCGHQGFHGQSPAWIDNGLRHIKDVCRYQRERIDAVQCEEERFDLLCELNVVVQVNNICHTTLLYIFCQLVGE